MADFDVDVLIVGAGPTGLMLANELTALGVSIRIVDRATVRSDKSRAVLVQSRAMELLDRHGLAQELLERGTIGRGIDVHVYGKKIAAMDIKEREFDDCAFPVSLLVSQAVTEDVLEKHLLETLSNSHPGVERPVKVTSVTEGEVGVTVVLEHASNDASSAAGSDISRAVPSDESSSDDVRLETVRCRYLVGCDGSHSAVRRAAGIPFEGGSYLQSFMLCDTHVGSWPDRPAGRTQMFWDKGFLTLLPFSEDTGIVRLIGCRPVPVTAAARERERLQAPTIESFSEYFAETTHMSGPDAPQLTDPIWVTSFRLHHRCASTYQSGRILIAGDAAHIHSPAGGQGMNAGLGDAANLGWKLATAIRTEPALPGVEDEHLSSISSSSNATTLTVSPLSIDRATDLLASYDLERRPVGERLLRTTDKLFTLATTASPFVAWCRNTMIRFLAPVIVRFKSRQQKIIGAMSQLRVRYRKSPIVGTAPGWKGTVRGGDRAPDGRVLDLGGSLDEHWLLNSIWAGEGECMGLTSYHLLVFTGTQPASRDAWDDVLGDVLDAAETAADIETGLNATRAHVIAGSTEQAVLVSKAAQHLSVMVDSKAYLHGRYGFGDEPGYALVRPDGHVEHIGRLPTLAQVPAWMTDRSREIVEVGKAKSWWRW
ncbi:monooxygenase fad-binding protein [Ophiostoma piceae UAMH 11346]|uniref:Monooxygenase fad-binding protein n=1 Tax=Ophiostoma piceae (strain UAMH 11346) TaxID=1262450 RepID=S3CHM1_OPHP1|nr:monooxygenase fad-binding protein [Ophiostoma piceae UAMH 11346]